MKMRISKNHRATELVSVIVKQYLGMILENQGDPVVKRRSSPITTLNGEKLKTIKGKWNQDSSVKVRPRRTVRPIDQLQL